LTQALKYDKFIAKGELIMVNIYEYTDYREYLKAYFADRKLWDERFSHRWLAHRLELSTSNFILLVMQGKRNINPGLCFRLSDVFKHSKKQSQYFEHMVNFCQAKTAKEKDIHFSRMTAVRKNIKVDKIAESQYEYYSNWYNPVIRELVCTDGIDSRAELIAKMLVPPIRPSQAKRSIALLQKLGFIKKRGKRYIQNSPYISTGPEVNSLAVHNFHKAMGTLAVESLDRIDKKERNITSSTIFVSKDTFNTIRGKIEDFRKELLALADSEKKGESVYQINMQVFPVSKAHKNKEHKA
jgi:uncharacterized protein (TIGR02147 family)